MEILEMIITHVELQEEVNTADFAFDENFAIDEEYAEEFDWK